ncbi:hypothetical protein [Streptomyces noursei]|uniref:hypothetical protein n=1 Tax=Streptomyces noursei TaxID=1971 RepID=UPI00381A3451
MGGAGELPDSKFDIDQLAELAKRLEGVEKDALNRALKAINYPARTQRISMYLGHATTVLGVLVGGGAVAAFVWLAHSMVAAHEAGYGVLICGLPASSIAAIFAIKKSPDFKALASMARQIQPAQTGQIPQARTAADGTPSPADQTGDGA